MKLIEICNLESDELKIYKAHREAELLHINEPDPGIFIAESPNVIMRALSAGYEPVSVLCDRAGLNTDSLRAIEMCKDVPVYSAGKEALAEITGYNLTRGLLCAMKRKPPAKADSILSAAKRVAVLEDIVNPTNLGAIFRSAAALNMDAVLLTKACTDPLYRRAARVSMGTAFQIPWAYIDSYDLLKMKGFKTVAMALKPDSYAIDNPIFKTEERLAVILGSEGPGLKASTIEAADYTVCIPMSHGVDSLNVAAASAVAFYELGKRI